MSIEYPIQIQSSDRQSVDAWLCSVNESHLEQFERCWKPMLIGTIEEDRYWEWSRKQRTYGARLGAETYAIVHNQMMQGLMLIETLGYRSWFAPNRRILYVHSLATAPWNRPSIQKPPRYRLVGSTLMEFARYRSEELKYDGLVGVHALLQAEEFYRRLGMIDCGVDSEKEQLVYFEWYKPSVRENWEDEINWEDED
jgi:hypothetical protein